MAFDWTSYVGLRQQKLIVCRHMQDELAHALIDVLEYTSNQINVYSLRQETSGKLQTLQGAGHFRNAANVLQTLTRLVS